MGIEGVPPAPQPVGDDAIPPPSSPAPPCLCGESLARAVNPPEGLTLPDGTYVRFRRRTDYVMCRSCLSLYRAQEVAMGKIQPLSGEDLLQS